jgi:transcription elongation GreA/GreB family factor
VKCAITSEGFNLFVQEQKKIILERQYWVKEKEVAAQFGDRSENAEYISAKEMLRTIDRRLRFLEKIISTSTVIEVPNLINTEVVRFGSSIRLSNDKTYTIKGTYEVDIDNNVISNLSPVGKQMIGKEVGDEIIIGDVYYEICAIF